MPRKKRENPMGDYIPTKEEQSAMRWCIDNHIKISPFAKGDGRWFIDIQMAHKKPHRSPKDFGPTEIWEVIYSYYKHYYKKTKK